MPSCEVCGKDEFDLEDGLYICRECLTVLPAQCELEQNEITRTQAITLKSSQVKSAISSEVKPEWVIYDGFNIILAQMTKSLLKCGVPQEIGNVVLGLWAAYLRNLGVSFCHPPVSQENDPTTNVQENELPNSDSEPDRLEIPEWLTFSRNSGVPLGAISDEETVKETENDSQDDGFPFVPKKMVVRKKRKKKPKENYLFNVPDSELSARDLSMKNRRIRRCMINDISKRDFNQQSLNGAETGENEEDEDDDCNRSSWSRRWSLIDRMPECFPEKSSSDKTSAFQKIAKFPTSRSVLTDPEYLTLAKLLSFVHGALILQGELTSHSDLIRWIREGWIPFHGAHQLLPPDMKLTNTDAFILGGVCQKNAWIVPLSSGIRHNTAKLLVMLGVPEIKLPPICQVAVKIVNDLQLPTECVKFIAVLERMVFPASGWRSKKLGDSIPSVESYAAAFLLIVMKLLVGLDGTSEFKISEFAEKVNHVLNLEPASSFCQHRVDPACTMASASPDLNTVDTKTLFVWEEWVQWIRFRRRLVDTNHVPSAIRHDCTSDMDPDLVLHYAESRGQLLSHLTKTTNSAVFVKEEIQRVLNNYVQENQGGNLDKKIPDFQPCQLPVQGLAEQLLEFDPVGNAALKQNFSASTLAYLIDQKPLAVLLKQANPSVGLKVCLGPPIRSVELVTPTIRRRKTMKSAMPVLQNKEIELKVGTISSACCFSDDDNDPSQEQTTLLLNIPSSAYWSLSSLSKQSKDDWELVSSQLPATFLWFLQMICESIEEEPHFVYRHMCIIESMIFQRNAPLLHTLTDAQTLKRRLVSALQSDINNARPL